LGIERVFLQLKSRQSNPEDQSVVHVIGEVGAKSADQTSRRFGGSQSVTDRSLPLASHVSRDIVIE
jgi:hypothetical protein